MRKFVIGLLLLVAVALGVSFYMHWLNVSWAVNKDKFKQDVDAAKDKVGQVAGGIKQGLTGHETVKGVVQWFNREDNQIRVDLDGNRDLMVNVNEATKVFLGTKPGDLADVKEGDTVTADTVVRSGKLFAESIRVETAY